MSRTLRIRIGVGAAVVLVILTLIAVLRMLQTAPPAAGSEAKEAEPTATSEVQALLVWAEPGAEPTMVAMAMPVQALAICPGWPQLVEIEAQGGGRQWATKQDAAQLLGLSLDAFDGLPASDLPACKAL